MVVDIVGYNKVEYVKDGKDRAFYKFFVVEVVPSDKVTFGRRCAEVLASEKYAEQKILPALGSDVKFYVGWQKDGARRPFLYVRKN